MRSTYLNHYQLNRCCVFGMFLSWILICCLISICCIERLLRTGSTYAQVPFCLLMQTLRSHPFSPNGSHVQMYICEASRHLHRHVPLEMMLEAIMPRMAGEAFSYERLETLGDAVLKQAASLHLHQAYPAAHEGVQG